MAARFPFQPDLKRLAGPVWREHGGGYEATRHAGPRSPSIQLSGCWSALANSVTNWSIRSSHRGATLADSPAVLYLTSK
jgi:hypothetical protein